MEPQVTRYESETGSYELVSRKPASPLRHHVEAYWGYEEHAAGPVRRVEVPQPSVIVVLGFGPTIRVGDVGRAWDALSERTSFVAGLHEIAARTEHAGESRGVEFALTPLGARMLLGLPMHELATRTVPAEDVLGARTPLLIERLHDAPSWRARFELLDRVLAARFADAPAPRREVEWAWRELRASGGRASIGRLGDDLGWSRRRLVAEFRDHVGLSPKTFARVLRFDRAVRLVKSGELPWADVAYACGYYDQAHFNRDFRAFAGMTPTEFAGRLTQRDPGVPAG